MTGLLITCDIFNMPNNKKNVSYFATHISPHKKKTQYAPLTLTVQTTNHTGYTPSAPHTTQQ